MERERQCYGTVAPDGRAGGVGRGNGVCKKGPVLKRRALKNERRLLSVSTPETIFSPIIMKLETLRDLYIHELKDLYSAEKQLIRGLPKMAKAATSEELRAGFEKHLEQTKEHASRLETILSALGESTRGPKCKGMEGLLAEGQEMIEEEADDEVRDAGLIAAAQRVEHYEIAGYGCARTHAELLGDDEGMELLQQTLDEEGETDKLLTQLAVSSINVSAAEHGDEDGESSGPRNRRNGRAGGVRKSQAAHA